MSACLPHAIPLPSSARGVPDRKRTRLFAGSNPSVGFGHGARLPIAVCTLAGLGLAAFSWKLIPSIETTFWGKPAKPAGSVKIVYDLLPLATLPKTQAA